VARRGYAAADDAGPQDGPVAPNGVDLRQDGDRYLLVASQGGAPKHPNWYLNLTDNPEVEVQVGAEKFKARARTATDEEKPRLWEQMTKIWPAYNDYQTKTSRPIPVVILERE